MHTRTHKLRVKNVGELNVESKKYPMRAILHTVGYTVCGKDERDSLVISIPSRAKRSLAYLTVAFCENGYARQYENECVCRRNHNHNTYLYCVAFVS